MPLKFEDPNLNNIKIPPILIASRLALLAMALSVASFIKSFSSNSISNSVFIVLGILFACNLILVLWYKVEPYSKWLLRSQTLADIFVVTGIIYISGGSNSPYIFLYLPLVFLTRAFGSLRIAIASSMLSIFLYTCVVYINFLINKTENFFDSFLAQVSLLSGSLIVVLLVSEHIVSILRRSEAQLKKSKIQLKELSKNQLNLLNKLPHGIIELSEKFEIKSINKKGSDILSTENNSIIGTNLADVFSRCVQKDVVIKKNQSDFIITGLENSFNYEFIVIGESPNSTLYIIFEKFDPENEDSNPDTSYLESKLRKLLSGEIVPLEETENGLTKPFIAESKLMKKVFSLIERAAPSDATVLIQGESGTGKELVARALHDRSDRRSKNFVCVNCSAIPEHLLESTFFGHKKGSFTGAITDSLGLIRESDGGTLFLDEIGDLPLHMQAKLLRVLQERQVRPIGGDRDFEVNLRIIAATNRNLKSYIESGQFRDDLYYRLNVISIMLPSLKERKEDLPILIHSFLNRLSEKTGLPQDINISSDALQLLLNYNYPGNVRELENILERSFVLGSGTILTEHLIDLIPDKKEQSSIIMPTTVPTEFLIKDDLILPLDLDHVLSSIEKKCILLALEKTSGHRSKAAELLGINLRSFRYRTQKLGI